MTSLLIVYILTGGLNRVGLSAQCPLSHQGQKATSTDLKILLMQILPSGPKSIPLVLLIANQHAFEPITFDKSDFSVDNVRLTFTDDRGKKIFPENDFYTGQTPAKGGDSVHASERFTLRPHQVYGYQDTFKFARPLKAAYAIARVSLIIYGSDDSAHRVQVSSDKVKVWPIRSH